MALDPVEPAETIVELPDGRLMLRSPKAVPGVVNVMVELLPVVLRLVPPALYRFTLYVLKVRLVLDETCIPLLI